MKIKITLLDIYLSKIGKPKVVILAITAPRFYTALLSFVFDDSAMFSTFSWEIYLFFFRIKKYRKIKYTMHAPNLYEELQAARKKVKEDNFYK